MRAHARYPITLPCRLELADGRVVDAWIDDISRGGVGVRISRDVALERVFALVVTHHEATVRLQCEVRHVRDLWKTRFVHARYQSLSVGEQQVVDGILRELTQAPGGHGHTNLPVRKLLGWLHRRG